LKLFDTLTSVHKAIQGDYKRKSRRHNKLLQQIWRIHSYSFAGKMLSDEVFNSLDFPCSAAKQLNRTLYRGNSEQPIYMQKYTFLTLLGRMAVQVPIGSFWRYVKLCSESELA